MVVPYYFRRDWAREAEKEAATTQLPANSERIPFVSERERLPEMARSAGKPRVSSNRR